jgi:hypothetical protein
MWLPDDVFMWTETCWSSFCNFNYFNNLRILSFVCISWTIKCLIVDTVSVQIEMLGVWFHPGGTTKITSARHLSVSWTYWHTCRITLKVLKIRPPPFWDVARRGLVVRYRRFGSICRQHLRGSRSPGSTNPSLATYRRIKEGRGRGSGVSTAPLQKRETDWQAFHPDWGSFVLFPQL